MFKRLFSTAVVFGAAALAPPVAAQPAQCLPRDILIERLEAQYSEQLTGGGLQNAARLLEIWSSPQTGSFTVFVTQANGLACVIATGQDWHSVPDMPMPAAKGVPG